MLLCCQIIAFSHRKSSAKISLSGLRSGDVDERYGLVFNSKYELLKRYFAISTESVW
jgi:hypothetical protein